MPGVVPTLNGVDVSSPFDSIVSFLQIHLHPKQFPQLIGFFHEKRIHKFQPGSQNLQRLAI
jgi:hypothetical protein